MLLRFEEKARDVTHATIRFNGTLLSSFKASPHAWRPTHTDSPAAKWAHSKADKGQVFGHLSNINDERCDCLVRPLPADSNGVAGSVHCAAVQLQCGSLHWFHWRGRSHLPRPEAVAWVKGRMVSVQNWRLGSKGEHEIATKHWLKLLLHNGYLNSNLVWQEIPKAAGLLVVWSWFDDTFFEWIH